MSMGMDLSSYIEVNLETLHEKLVHNHPCMCMGVYRVHRKQKSSNFPGGRSSSPTAKVSRPVGPLVADCWYVAGSERVHSPLKIRRDDQTQAGFRSGKSGQQDFFAQS